MLALLLGCGSVRGSNLLVNPSFEANGGHVVAIGWTYFSPPPPPGYYGDYWVESQTGIAHSGTFYWKEWGALYEPAPTNNVAGIYEEFSSAPGSTYQASGWFYTSSGDLIGADCQVWLDVSFLDASTNLLALYKSDTFNAAVGSDTWFQYQVTNACDLSSPVSLGDPYFTAYSVTGAVSQLVAPPGTKLVRYRYCYLQVAQEGGSAFFDDAVLDQISGSLPPVIGNVFPLNMIFINPSDGLSFSVNSPSGYTINNSSIGLVLNGVDVSSNLAISGSSSNKTVTYHGLQSNMTYTASISVTDSFNFSASANTYFETTWVGIPPIVYLWEAEDFDFTNGMYIDIPDLCTNIGDPNCYFGTVGTEGVDEHSSSSSGNHSYRPGDGIPTAPSGDLLRKNLFEAGRTDYEINPFIGGEWVNYTRDWSNGTYWIIGRLATDIGLSGSLTLSVVNPDSTTTDLGTFTIANGRGWTAFDNVFLMDTNGNIAAITLTNKSTLRVTSGGNLLPNFFALVAGQIDLPVVKGLYPDGAHPFEYTNELSFTVTTTGATFPASGIQLNLDGVDVSSNLVITGTSSSNSVVLPTLLPNALHTAVINVTNSLGHGISVTNQFDTFTEGNPMVEAEDFDYGGGQFVSPWFPDAYSGLSAVTNVDYFHTSVAGEQYAYRPDGIPTALAQDYLRQTNVLNGAQDYDLAWFAGGDWANYTRVYPTGNFYVYGRFAGSGTYSMHLDQVVSGVGTTSQVTKRLGHWSAVGQGYQIHNWVPLRDEGLSMAVTVGLGGTNTLRISTDGYCNPNYFMLVPASGIPVQAAHAAGNNVLSFPTQPGVTYWVLYRNDLASTTWSVLTTVTGDGSTKSVTDSITGSKRFYKIVVP